MLQWGQLVLVYGSLPMARGCMSALPEAKLLLGYKWARRGEVWGYVVVGPA